MELNVKKEEIRQQNNQKNKTEKVNQEIIKQIDRFDIYSLRQEKNLSDIDQKRNAAPHMTKH